MYYENDWLLEKKDYPAKVEYNANEQKITLSNGLAKREFTLKPDFATINILNETTNEAFSRGVKPEVTVTIDNVEYSVGGALGQCDYAYLKEEWLSDMTANEVGFNFVEYEVLSTEKPFEWNQKKRRNTNPNWQPKGIQLKTTFASKNPEITGIKINVFYEMYDNIPLMGKWFTIENNSNHDVRLNSYKGEIIAIAEHEHVGSESYRSSVGANARNITVTSNFSNVLTNTTFYEIDPDYSTQVDFMSQYKCLLVSRPPLGPNKLLKIGEKFTSFKTYTLLHEDTDRNRRGFTIDRMYATLAPWATENPILLHVTSTNYDVVKEAVDQCVEVGFEMIILSFGSGLNMESTDDEYIQKIKKMVDYAHSKGIEIGGYSLLASRSIDKETDIINPSPIFGNSPCLCSKWGAEYFENIKNFIEKTGFDLLEHDGSYPGDTCASTDHIGHENYDDSLYAQMQVIMKFYEWCREKGIYLNVPDWYFLQGANKIAMGYKEVNWSLPRERQILIGRQNVYDGTWEKLPSMGWMFVPLTQYHGGGEAATIEPLCDHLEQYAAHMNYNFKAGVQACYRGFRAYDTEKTKEVVSGIVQNYKKYRDILESPIYHIRRPDGKDYDGYLHVNPKLDVKGMLVLFNPLLTEIEREITVPLYYTGIEDKATVSQNNTLTGEYVLSRQYTIKLKVKIPACDCVSYEIR